MRLFGIDPAPAKNSLLFDGEEFFSFNSKELKEFLNQNVNKNTLISWDAPLGDNFEESLSYKPIEKILNTKANYKNEQKPPRGISTLPFSQCPHWSISQYLLGYPIINNDIVDYKKLKYHLVQNNTLSTTKPNLFETHPAYSIWLFTKDRLDEFEYKKSKKIFAQIVDTLFEKEEIKKYNFIKSKIINDDYLDSFIAFINLELFLEKKAFVYGNSRQGAMLLPKLDGILKDDILNKLI